MTLENFLEQKPLYYSEIDYTRMPRAYASIKERLKLPKIIHLVGTNGKGTTGRFIANALVALGKSTGHYTSPHISKFNERIWLNGNDIDNASLNRAHDTLYALLDDSFKTSLSYFEYTTLLAIVVYQECDYVVLEAGLGGEHDATNVFEKILSVITPIGIDHEDFLGDSIEEIAGTKLRSVTSKAIVGEQKYKEVFTVARELEDSLGVEFISYRAYLDKTLISLSEEIAQEMELPNYLRENLLLAMSVIKELGYIVKKKLFDSQRLLGRMQRLEPNVWVDVGHNSLAAEAISHCFRPHSINLIYNSYKDKDYLSILTLLKPIVKRVEIIEVDDSRIVAQEDLVSALEKVGLEHKPFEGIVEDENYLVFGSFSVAEAFIKRR